MRTALSLSLTDSFDLWRGDRIDPLAQEMRDKFAIVIVDVIDQPSLDEARKSIGDIEVLGALPEFVELFGQLAMFQHMRVGIGKREQAHQALLHPEMNPRVDVQLGKDRVHRMAVTPVAGVPQAFQQIIELAVLTVDLGNAELEFPGCRGGAVTCHNLPISLVMV